MMAEPLVVGLSIMLTGATISLGLFRSVVTPVGVYAFVWAAVLLATSIHPLVGIDYIPIMPDTWALVLAASFAYMLGCTTGGLLNLRRSRCPLSNSSALANNRVRDIGRILVATSVSAVGAKWFILVHTFGSVSTVLTNIGDIRLAILQGSFRFPIFTDVLVVLLFPGLVALSTFTPPIWSRDFVWIFVGLVTLLINDLASASRGTSFHGLLLVVLTYMLIKYYYRQRDDIWRWLVIGGWMCLGMAFAFLALNVIRMLREGLELTFENYIRDALFGLYLYTTGPTVACNEVLHSDVLKPYLGAYTLGGLYRIINIVSSSLLGMSVVPDIDKPYVFIPYPFNSYAYFCLVYADLGVVGAVVVPWLMGSLACYAWGRYRARPSWGWLVANVTAFAWIVLSPRDTMTFWISFWSTLVIGWLMGILGGRVGGRSGERHLMMEAS
ncbi:MAG: hypothetical protein C4291_15405 [Candidatus Dadabacteria bacterium]